MTAPNSCTVCGCIPSNINNEYFKQAVLSILCAILESQSPPLSMENPLLGRVVNSPAPKPGEKVL